MKQDFWGVLNNFIINNQNSNWDMIFKVVLVFLIAFWLTICLWVFIDARSRYTKFIVAMLITLFTLIFNIPALIIYVILRPEHTREEISLIANATSPFKQNLPIELEKSVIDSKNSFTMHFALNFTPGIDGDKPKIEFTVDSMEGLPLSEEIIEQKKLAENVEVIKEEGIKVEQVVTLKNENESKELKEVEQLPLANTDAIVENKKVKLGEKARNFFFNIKIFKKRIKKEKKIENKTEKKPRKPIFKGVGLKIVSLKAKLFPLKVTKPTEVILPEENTQASSEKLAKSKKKKKNRNRRH
ncbi:MAG: hypothetical protein WCK31_00710 [bacterium]